MARKRERLHLPDLFLLLLLICAISGAILRWLDLRSDGSVTDESGEILLRIEKIPLEVADCLAVGDALYLADATRFGTISNLDQIPARIVLEKDGEFLIGTLSDAVDLRVTVRVRGIRQGSLFLRDGRFPLPRALVLDLYTDRAFVRGVVIG